MNPEDMNLLVNIIQEVADEQGYEIENRDNQRFQVYIDRYHTVAFEVFANPATGYIQVHLWEEDREDEENGGRYGRAVYSLRNYSDAIHFCNIMISSSEIRARRPN